MTNKKILIVDDEPDVLQYLKVMLEDNGFSVITAQNGKDAFDLALKEKPDLITLDITMPEESGVRAYRNLYETEETKNIPIIIVTGISHDFKKFISERKQVPPPVAYFEKPIDREEFLNKIKEVLKL